MIASFLASQIVKKRRMIRTQQQQEQQKTKQEKSSKSEPVLVKSKIKKTQINGKFYFALSQSFLKLFEHL